MTEILLQSAVTASKSSQLAEDAAQIRANCHAQHGDNKPLVSCPQCYGTLLEALRARFLLGDQQQQQQQREWFTTRRTFLSALDLMINEAKEYQLSPRAIDDRIREERSRWYAERVRGLLLRLMVEDPSGRGAVFEKLEDLSTATTTGSDSVQLVKEVAEILSTGPLAVEQAGAGEDLRGRLATTKDQAGMVEVLKEAFFTAEDGDVPQDQQKYLDMLRNQGLSMEQVVDRILEEAQTAIGAREQTDKLNQRLEELRRARAAYEAQKTRRAQRRESLALQLVPDELYEPPACAACGDTPSTRDFFCCSICTILEGKGVLPQQTVFCSENCEEKGQAAHAETHTCASSTDCVQLHHQNPPTSGSTAGEDEDTAMQEAPPAPNDLRFCIECLTTLKKPTMWCSLACADANFARHREEVHLPERKKLGLDVDDGAELECHGSGGAEGERRYRASGIGAVTTALGEAVSEWEGRNRVPLYAPA